TVDEPRQVPRVEVAKPVDLLHHLNGARQSAHEPPRRLEVEISALGEDVEQQVAARARRGTSPGRERSERTEARRPSSRGDGIPELRAEADRADEPGTRVDGSDLVDERRCLGGDTCDSGAGA